MSRWRIPVAYVSHSIQEVARIADHLVLLQGGKVAASASASELLPAILPQFDLPYVHEEEAFTLLPGTIVAHVDEDFLSCVTVGDRTLWMRRLDRPVGTPIRIRVLARDVSITLHECRDSSILNIVPVRVESVVQGQNGVALVKMRLSGSEDAVLVARITMRSARRLGLDVGQAVFAQIKAVAPLA
jgi:molybdate transport system ATP-binding protein